VAAVSEIILERELLRPKRRQKPQLDDEPKEIVV
jgi:hypothetical protein